MRACRNRTALLIAIVLAPSLANSLEEAAQQQRETMTLIAKAVKTAGIVPE